MQKYIQICLHLQFVVNHENKTLFQIFIYDQLINF